MPLPPFPAATATAITPDPAARLLDDSLIAPPGRIISALRRAAQRAGLGEVNALDALSVPPRCIEVGNRG